MIAVGFFSSNSLASRVIRWATGSKVSHVGIIAQVAGVPVMVHATVGGVQVTTLRSELKRSRLVASLSTTKEVALSEAVKRIGQKYDYAGLIGFIFVLLYRRLGLSVRNPLAGANSVVCSEFVASVLGEDVDPEQVTPEDLLRRLSSSPSYSFITGIENHGAH